MLVNLLTYLADTSSWAMSVYTQDSGLGASVASSSKHVVGGSLLMLFILMAVAVLFINASEKFKFTIFTMMATVMIGATLILVTSGIYITTNSDSRGLTKRQAGIEFWVCGNQINLIDPSGISDKTGSSTVYESNDNLAHIEGVVVDDSIDGTLGKFMHAVGGVLLDDTLIIPVNPDGSIFSSDSLGNGISDPYPREANKFLTLVGQTRYVKALNGQLCGDKPSEVQVFAYSFDKDSDTYQQTKLVHPQDYVFADEDTVPPGDCVIVEFGPKKDKTDKLCQGYGEVDNLRCTEFGVSADNKSSCTAQQLDYSSIGTGSDPNIDKEAF